jgi:3-oxoadipate enol-lactonase
MYYEAGGQGQPLVLIPGLRSDVSEYEPIIALLSKKSRLVALDNRGAGRTDKPDMPYSIGMMADDTVNLINALGIRQAHFLGVSMVGKIAADIALRYPESVKRLILVSTGLKRQGKPGLASRWIDFALSFPLFQRMGKYPQPYYASIHQRDASRNYDCMDRLAEIRAPTMIMHGKKDRVVPYDIAEQMHAGIKGSILVPFSDGHIFFYPASAVHRKSVGFLGEVIIGSDWITTGQAYKLEQGISISMEPIEVIAHFSQQGVITPSQFSKKGGTYHVQSTGRYWRDDVGYHILVMVLDDQIYELIFKPGEGRWYMGPAQPKRMLV